MKTMKQILKENDCMILSHDNSFVGDEIVVRIPITGSYKKYYDYFNKSFPRKDFRNKICKFLGVDDNDNSKI